MGQPMIIQIENIFYPILAVVGVPGQLLLKFSISGYKVMLMPIFSFLKINTSLANYVFAGNLLTIVILSRGSCGLSKCISRYLMAMAVADLLVLIFDVILYEIKDAYFRYSFLNYTSICCLNFVFVFASIDCSVWLTVAFTFDRFVIICCQKIRIRYCTELTAAIVIAVVCSLSIIENVPIYFIYEPGKTIDNVPWSCYVKSSFYDDLEWTTFLWIETILTPFAPFVLIMLLNVLTIRHILQVNKLREGFRGNNTGEGHNDAVIENRRKSIILLLAISANFIILWVLTLISYLLVQFSDVQYLEENQTDSFSIIEKFGYMLSILSSCTNTLIYALSQRKFRDELACIIKHPLTLICHVCQNIKLHHGCKKMRE